MIITILFYPILKFLIENKFCNLAFVLAIVIYYFTVKLKLKRAAMSKGIVSLHYQMKGEGPSLIFVHGFPLSHEMWNPQFLFFTKNNFNVIVPDLRGFGLSSVEHSDQTMDDFADDIISLANKLEIEKFSVVGMSMGGYIVFNLLERYPTRIDKVILVATKASADDEKGKERRNQLIDLALTKGKKAVTEEFKKILFAPLTWEKRKDLITEVSFILESASLNGIVGSLKAMRDRKDYVEFLSKINNQTLVIHGKSDLASPISNAELMVEKIPNAKYYYSEIAGHLVNLEDAEKVNEVILEFLKE